MDDHTAVVTGASRGIGEHVARAFGEAGAYVACAARNRDAVETVAADVRAAGGQASAHRTDVRDERDIEWLMHQVRREQGEIHVVVANAGVNHAPPGDAPLHEEPYARFDDTMRTNARGVFATIREAAPHLSAESRVLVPSGRVAREPTPGMGVYAVSKAAAEALVRGFAADLDAAVCVVDPGRVATDLAGGTGREPEAVADMFRWAATAATDVDGATLDLKTWEKATR